MLSTKVAKHVWKKLILNTNGRTFLVTELCSINNLDLTSVYSIFSNYYRGQRVSVVSGVCLQSSETQDDRHTVSFMYIASEGCRRITNSFLPCFWPEQKKTCNKYQHKIWKKRTSPSCMPLLLWWWIVEMTKPPQKKKRKILLMVIR